MPHSQTNTRPNNINPEMKLWHVIGMIPKGSVCTYGTLATLVERPGCARWVGRVLGDLPQDTELPWHRVLRADGTIASRASAPEQASRLRDEGVEVKGYKVNIKKYSWPDHDIITS